MNQDEISFLFVILALTCFSVFSTYGLIMLIRKWMKQSTSRDNLVNFSSIYRIGEYEIRCNSRYKFNRNNLYIIKYNSKIIIGDIGVAVICDSVSDEVISRFSDRTYMDDLPIIDDVGEKIKGVPHPLIGLGFKEIHQEIYKKLCSILDVNSFNSIILTYQEGSVSIIATELMIKISVKKKRVISFTLFSTGSEKGCRNLFRILRIYDKLTEFELKRKELIEFLPQPIAEEIQTGSLLLDLFGERT